MNTKQTEKQYRSGVINALSAYVLWGFAPIYFKLIGDIPSAEILVHRILWSSILLAIIVILMRKSAGFIALIKQPNILIKLTISASFLAVNWFLFIWAINNNHLLDASLGYFINPLFSVALGMLFLGERLRKWQKIAVILAIVGVFIQLMVVGSLPIISLALAGTFGIYGLLRKKMHIDSFIGLLLESLMMLPIALCYWAFYMNSASSNLFENTLTLNALLMTAGIVTTAPLLCFTAAAKRLPLSTLGFFQYIGPSIMFILAIVFYQESLVLSKIITFVFIWSALAIYTLDGYLARKHLAKNKQAKTKTVKVNE